MSTTSYYRFLSKILLHRFKIKIGHALKKIINLQISVMVAAWCYNSDGGFLPSAWLVNLQALKYEYSSTNFAFKHVCFKCKIYIETLKIIKINSFRKSECNFRRSNGSFSKESSLTLQTCCSASSKLRIKWEPAP